MMGKRKEARKKLGSTLHEREGEEGGRDDRGT